MRLLLDTHAFLWWRIAEARLSSEIRVAVGAAEVVFVSMASAWEIGIKTSLGKLHIAEPVEQQIAASDFEPLSIEFRHIEKVASLPLHHRDPFDRMLVAQSLVEGLTLVTADRRLQSYPIPVLWL